MTETTPRRKLPAKYPLQIIAMVDADTKAEILDYADYAGTSVSAAIRALVQFGLAAKKTAVVMAAYPDADTEADALSEIESLGLEEQARRDAEIDANARLARLRARGL